MKEETTTKYRLLHKNYTYLLYDFTIIDGCNRADLPSEYCKQRPDKRETDTLYSLQILEGKGRKRVIRNLEDIEEGRRKKLAKLKSLQAVQICNILARSHSLR